MTRRNKEEPEQQVELRQCLDGFVSDVLGGEGPIAVAKGEILRGDHPIVQALPGLFCEVGLHPRERDVIAAKRFLR
jgi:hypothetical protein